MTTQDVNKELRKKVTHLIQQYDDGHLIDMPLSEGSFVDIILTLIQQANEALLDRILEASGKKAITTLDTEQKAGLIVGPFVRCEDLGNIVRAERSKLRSQL